MILHIPIGLPGCGKSTLQDKLSWELDSFWTISPDFWRRKILSKIGENILFYPPIEVFVWRNAYQELKDIKKYRYEHVFFDATNITRKSRAELIKRIKPYGGKIIVHLFKIHPKLCILRNEKREKPVPRDVILHMMDTFQSPKFDEGIDIIDLVYIFPSKEEKKLMNFIKLY